MITFSRMKRSFLLMKLTLMATLMQAQEIPLYDSVPGSKPAVLKERSDMYGTILSITHVSQPTITPYFPAPGKKNGTSVIICPGGGYSGLAAGHEGRDVAKVFNEWGITAFVLKYRLPDTAIMTDKRFGPLQDAQRAIQLVRQHAAEWQIDPHKVGIMGFSAGGHLAASASTHFQRSFISNPDSISLRPDFSVLIYPVISFTDSLTHAGSRNNLIGPVPDPADIQFFSNELQVNAMTPPAFLVHASDDRDVPIGNSLTYLEALVRHGIKAELVTYAAGGHGFGMNNPTSPVIWMDQLRKWLGKRHFL